MIALISVSIMLLMLVVIMVWTFITIQENMNSSVDHQLLLDDLGRLEYKHMIQRMERRTKK